MMAIVRAEPSSAAALLERLRIALGSIHWFGTTEAAAAATWCVRGRAVLRAPARQGPL